MEDAMPMTPNTTNDLNEDISAVRDSAKALFDKGGERARELGSQISQRASQISEQALERGRNAVGTLERSIGEHPVIAIGTAFVGGLLLGAILLRRD
jgi:ElaB/YqjD/DUF883 family membrane-anchored ribosome-binding protein